MKKIELMAPAGDLERLKIALLYGADAVYIGGKEYSLRANASNFSLEDIKKACSYAHKLHKKVYVTVNIIFHNEDLDDIEKYIKELIKVKVDALIIADVYLIDIIKKLGNIDIFLSTQNASFNYENIKYYEKEKIKRIVLPRELTHDEIEEIRKKTELDLEMFIHGAMCTFYSGRCVLSNYFTNRDSNRGGCAQVCRFNLELNSKSNKNFSMATKDLVLAKYIKSIIDLGINSLKIEGRMRSAYYLATVIKSYRTLIDAYYNNTLDNKLIKNEEKILKRVANRESTAQYYKRKANYHDQYYGDRNEESNQDFLAIVTGYDKDNKCLILEQRNYFKVLDKVTLFGPEKEEINLTLDKIYDKDMNSINCANHPQEIIKIKYEKNLPINTMMRIYF